MTVLESALGADRIRLLDVGARGGLDQRWRRFESRLELTGFEPDPVECERLNRSAAALPYPARFLPYALWREARDGVPFHVCRWEVASSIYPPNEQFLRAFPLAQNLLGVKEKRTISTARLDDVCRDEGLRADCLKLDVEGAELDVIKGAEATLEELLVLELEAEFNPLFEGQPLFADLDRHLRDRGWILLGLRRNSWRRGGLDQHVTGFGGQLIAADVLYVSGRAMTDELSPIAELKLLVILAAYLQSDLVLERLRGSHALARRFSARERAALERALVPRPGPLARIARRALRGLDSERRRALADALAHGEDTVWQDPYFF